MHLHFLVFHFHFIYLFLRTMHIKSHQHSINVPVFASWLILSCTLLLILTTFNNIIFDNGFYFFYYQGSFWTKQSLSSIIFTSISIWIVLLFCWIQMNGSGSINSTTRLRDIWFPAGFVSEPHFQAGAFPLCLRQGSGVLQCRGDRSTLGSVVSASA